MRAEKTEHIKISPSGFTLIELCIVIAIIGLLAAIALPSYKKSVTASQRASAQAQLTDCSQKMERFYAASMSYKGASVSNSGGAGTCSLTASGLSVSAGQTYSVAFASTPTATAYALVATPSTDQSSDRCKSLCMDNSGAKIAGAASGPGNSTTCSALIPSAVPGCW